MPLQLSDYEEIEIIGSGSFGCCKKVRRKSDRKIFAWKEIDYSLMTEKERRLLTNEVNALRNLSHPHILSYTGHILDKINRVLYIVTEYCVGGDLSSLIKKQKRTCTVLSEDFIWKVLCQILFALRECHDISKGGSVLLHRDVKPANVFLTDKMDVKLGDFGMARMLPSTSAFARTYLGSPIYMSPELVSNCDYNDKSDIWGLGCLIYELCALTPPFTAPNMSLLAKKIVEGKVDRIPSRYSDDLDLVVRKMLTVKLDRRPTAETLMNRSVVTARCNELNLQWKSTNIAESLEKKAKELSVKEKHLQDLERALDKKEKKLDKVGYVANALIGEKENELAKMEKQLRDRELALDKMGKKLEKQEIWLNLQSKLLEERSASIEEYANVCKHLGLHLGQPLRDLKDPQKSKGTNSLASSSQSSSTCSRSGAQRTDSLASSSLSSSNGSRNTLKHVHFQDSGHPAETKAQNKLPNEGTRRPVLNSANKENLPCNGPQVDKLDELKSSLRRANQRALQLRMAEMESWTRFSPFI